MSELKTNEGSTLKRGFEVYYFDGKGGRQGPIGFEEMLNLMGVLDAEEQAGNDNSLYDQLPLPFYAPAPTQEEGFVPDRESSEQAGTRTGDETSEGVRD